MLFTCYDDKIRVFSKRIISEDYNKIKLFVDTSNEMAFYTSLVRKKLNWYIQLFFHIFTQIAVKNA